MFETRGPATANARLPNEDYILVFIIFDF